MKSVGTALDALGKLAVLEAANEGAVAIRTIIDVEEVIVWLNVEARMKFLQKQMELGKGKLSQH